MIKFNIITIFPDVFDSYFSESIIGRAEKEKRIQINTHNLRDYAIDKHNTVDDSPYGGGPGMVMTVEPIFKAVAALKKRKAKSEKRKVILFSAKGEKFNQGMAHEFSQLDQLIMICGRYEGVDERVAQHIADVEISVGDYILTGGEIPAMAVVDAVTRLVPGVIKDESIEENRFKKSHKPQATSHKRVSSYPVYTRPEEFKPKEGSVWKVPGVLLSGDHKKIATWREVQLRISLASPRLVETEPGERKEWRRKNIL